MGVRSRRGAPIGKRSPSDGWMYHDLCKQRHDANKPCPSRADDALTNEKPEKTGELPSERNAHVHEIFRPLLNALCSPPAHTPERDK